MQDSQSNAPRTKASAWRAAEEYGCDMSLVEENLRLTPQQRIRQHDRALRTLHILREAFQRSRVRS